MFVHQAVGPFGFGRTMQATVRCIIFGYANPMWTARGTFEKTEPNRTGDFGRYTCVGAREHQESLNQGYVV